MKSDVQVYYTLFGFDCKPEEITRVVGLKPSEVRDEGRPRLVEREWTIASALPAGVDLPTQVKALLDALEPAWSALSELGRRFDAAIVCVVRSYHGDRPAIWFEKEIVRRAAELNASLEIDLYVLP